MLRRLIGVGKPSLWNMSNIFFTGGELDQKDQLYERRLIMYLVNWIGTWKLVTQLVRDYQTNSFIENFDGKSKCWISISIFYYLNRRTFHFFWSRDNILWFFFVTSLFVLFVRVINGSQIKILCQLYFFWMDDIPWIFSITLTFAPASRHFSNPL